MSRNSRIFQRNRVLGYVCNDVPLVTRYIKNRSENLVVTSIGRCFHTYGCNKLAVLSISGHHPADIFCLAADTYHIYSSCGNEIYAWRRGTELKHTYRGHTTPVHIILPLGAFLLAVDETSLLKVWIISTEEEVLDYPFQNDYFEVTAVIHPFTYLNKLLLGSKQGTMQLLNIHTSKLIYTFRGWDCEITVLEQAPAIDVIAVGLLNGKIVLHNIKYDKTLIEVMQDWGTVTSISFRTDGPPTMVSGSLMGHIVLWNLDEKKPLTQLISAHQGAVTGIKCLPNEPMMVTSSPDNSLRMWIFDMPDGGARLLRRREGHSSPPTCIRYHGNDGHNILSAGGDSTLRIFSTITERFNKSLGIASFNRKILKKKTKKEDTEDLIMPPITCFSSETAREKEWDDIAAAHLGMGTVTTWSYGNVKMGNFKLVPKELKSNPAFRNHEIWATCVFLTRCGNFVLIGYNCGEVHKFNIQSGIHRGTYGNPTAHAGAVQGVCCDALNRVVVSGGSDGYIKFWHFRNIGAGAQPVGQLDLEEGVLKIQLHSESSLLAVALEDYQVLLVDLDTRRVVRCFTGHTAQVTDMTFSPDARWLVTAAMDSSVRTWDIVSANLIDIFMVASPCTSLSFSPTGDRLATSHVNYLGVFLWSNRCVFEHVSLTAVWDLEDVPLMPLPTSYSQVVQKDDSEIDDPIDTFPVSCEQISKDLITFSKVASSRWQNLLNIDIIWQKNKPKNLLQKPKSAPFFLPTIPALDIRFDLSAELVDNNDSSNKSLLGNVTSGFQKLLALDKFDDGIAKLKELGPSAVNFELTTLTPEGGGSVKIMGQFLKLIEFILQSNKDFELCQAYLALFLKKHGDTVASEDLLYNNLKTIQGYQENSWNILQSKLMSCLCIIEFLKEV